MKRKKSTKEGGVVKSSKKDGTSKRENLKEGGNVKKERGERRAKKVRLDDFEDEDKDENDAGLEDAYAKGRVAKLAGKDKDSHPKKTKTNKVNKTEEEVEADAKMQDADAHDSSESEGEDDEEEDASRLVHESLSGPKSRKDRRGKRTKKEKFVPQEETIEQRNDRTIFVGNVAVEVAKSKVCFDVPFISFLLVHSSTSLSVIISWSPRVLITSFLMWRNIVVRSQIFQTPHPLPPSLLCLFHRQNRIHTHSLRRLLPSHSKIGSFHLRHRLRPIQNLAHRHSIKIEPRKGPRSFLARITRLQGR